MTRFSHYLYRTTAAIGEEASRVFYLNSGLFGALEITDEERNRLVNLSALEVEEEQPVLITPPPRPDGKGYSVASVAAFVAAGESRPFGV